MTTQKLVLLLLFTPLLSVYAGPETPEATVKAYFAATQTAGICAFDS